MLFYPWQINYVTVAATWYLIHLHMCILAKYSNWKTVTIYTKVIVKIRPVQIKMHRYTVLKFCKSLRSIPAIMTHTHTTYTTKNRNHTNQCIKANTFQAFNSELFGLNSKFGLESSNGCNQSRSSKMIGNEYAHHVKHEIQTSTRQFMYVHAVTVK